jgi:TRAP-type mannitol/chloroaromatic compound transport system permease large subunit
MGSVYRGIIPFLCLQIVALLICAALPGLVMWLPKLMSN